MKQTTRNHERRRVISTFYAASPSSSSDVFASNWATFSSNVLMRRSWALTMSFSLRMSSCSACASKSYREKPQRQVSSSLNHKTLNEVPYSIYRYLYRLIMYSTSHYLLIYIEREIVIYIHMIYCILHSSYFNCMV